MRKFIALLIFLPLLVTACASGETSVEENILLVIFDGENCIYKGPTNIRAGNVTVIFLNESEEMVAVNLARHKGDETIQDAIDHIGEEPSTMRAPNWTKDIRGVWHAVLSGKFHKWEGDLEPGIHSMF